MNKYVIDSFYFNININSLKYLIVRYSKAFGNLKILNEIIYDNNITKIDDIIKNTTTAQKNRRYTFTIDNDLKEFLETIEIISKEQPKKYNAIQKLNTYFRMDIVRWICIFLFTLLCIVIPLIGIIVIIRVIVGRDGIT